MSGTRPKRSSAVRLSEKYRIDPDTDCWLWTGGLDPSGYGKLRNDDGRMRGAHRLSYEILRGPIAAGMELDHLCRNRRCVNPDHLEPVTHTENVRRGALGTAHWQRAKTHCPKGHPLSGDNLYVKPTTGWRQCRTCRNEQARAQPATNNRPARNR